MDMSSMSGMAMSATSTAMAMTSTGMSMAMGTSTAMDMGTSTGMSMDMGTATGTAATASSTMDMSSSDSSMGGCKISMLWNWYTIDTCFIAETWHNDTRAKFGGSCIGVICLVMVLEALRRSVKEYDRYLIRQHLAKFDNSTPVAAGGGGGGSSNGSKDNVASSGAAACPAGVVNTGFRPNVFQQAIRALLHMLQFAVAYFVMLLAMYYNGYIIICIFIGAYLGSFIFQWEKLGASAGQTSASQEATVCCG